MKKQEKVHWFWWFAFWVLLAGGPIGWALMLWLWFTKLKPAKNKK